MDLPYRGDGTARPDLPLPPGPMALWRDRRPLKRWRYVGAYGEDFMLCAARVRIGGLPQAFWAVWDRRTRALRERTVFRHGPVEVEGRVRFPGADLRLEPCGDVVEVVSRHGGSYIWTRKQPARVHGMLDGAAVDLAALIDDSAGYHARETTWTWSAGAGVTKAGAALVWNLVDGVHDAAAGSERTVWVDGAAHEVERCAFAADLCRVGDLRFAAEAQRSRDDDLKLFRSSYRQPFGTFSGALPGGIELAQGFGVMEHHDVRW